MRLISNEEVLVVSGGVQQVVITGTRLSWWDTIFDYISDFFKGNGGGDGLSISQYNNLQAAYAEANATGSPVTVETTSIPVTIKATAKGGVEVSAQFSGNTKRIVTVKPAGTNLPITVG